MVAMLPHGGGYVVALRTLWGRPAPAGSGGGFCVLPKAWRQSADIKPDMSGDTEPILASTPGQEAASGWDMPHLIREIRTRLGLTQEQFAARLGVTFPTINRWENHRAKPSPLALRQVEALLRELADQGQDLLGVLRGPGRLE